MNIELIDNTLLGKLQDIVASSSKVLIFCHTNADGDALSILRHGGERNTEE